MYSFIKKIYIFKTRYIVDEKCYKPNHLIDSKGKLRNRVCPKIAMNETQSRMNKKKVLQNLMSRSTWIKELATKSSDK